MGAVDYALVYFVIWMLKIVSSRSDLSIFVIEFEQFTFSAVICPDNGKNPYPDTFAKSARSKLFIFRYFLRMDLLYNRSKFQIIYRPLACPNTDNCNAQIRIIH